MIKAIAEKDGKPLYIFGLSLGNCERLLSGKPILIDLDVMAREIADSRFRGSVMIMGGESEQSIVAQLATVADLPATKKTHNDEN